MEKTLAALSTNFDPSGLVFEASYCLPKSMKSSHVDHFEASVAGSLACADWRVLCQRVLAWLNATDWGRAAHSAYAHA